MEFSCKFKSADVSIILSNDEANVMTVGDLKRKVAELFNLELKTVKILGIKLPASASKSPLKGDDLPLSALQIKQPVHKINVIGTAMEALDSMVAMQFEAEELEKQRRAQQEIEEKRRWEEQERLRIQREIEEKKREEIRQKALEERMERDRARREAEEVNRRAVAEAQREAELSNVVPGGDPDFRSIRFEMRSFSSWDLNSNLNEDRLQLSPYMLENLIGQGAKFPLVFRVAKVGGTAGKYAYIGVKDFNGIGDEIASVPRRVLENLEAEEGDVLRYETFNAPRGEFVKFKPRSDLWFRIPEEERKALLEFELRKFQFLVQNKVIRIKYDLQDFALLIEETKPAEVISMVDTELQTDFSPAAEFSEYSC
jgi:hypothetical protein